MFVVLAASLLLVGSCFGANRSPVQAWIVAQPKL